MKALFEYVYLKIQRYLQHRLKADGWFVRHAMIPGTWNTYTGSWGTASTIQTQTFVRQFVEYADDSWSTHTVFYGGKIRGRQCLISVACWATERRIRYDSLLYSSAGITQEYYCALCSSGFPVQLRYAFNSILTLELPIAVIIVNAAIEFRWNTRRRGGAEVNVGGGRRCPAKERKRRQKSKKLELCGFNYCVEK